MQPLFFLAMLATAPLLQAQPVVAEPVAEPVAAPKPAPCATSGGLLPGSGLCRDEAMARLPMTRLPMTGSNAWTPPIGCDMTAQEAPLPDGRWLLYAAQRCGEQIARLEATPAEQGAIALRYAETARNGGLAGRKVLTLVEGRPVPYEAIYALVMAGLPPRQAQRCALRSPEIEGYPIDAYVFDLPPAEARKAAALDTPCGPYGRSARTDSYWRMFDGVGVFYVFGDDQPEFDPASLTVYKPGS